MADSYAPNLSRLRQQIKHGVFTTGNRPVTRSPFIISPGNPPINFEQRSHKRTLHRQVNQAAPILSGPAFLPDCPQNKEHPRRLQLVGQRYPFSRLSREINKGWISSKTSPSLIRGRPSDISTAQGLHGGTLSSILASPARFSPAGPGKVVSGFTQICLCRYLEM
jgi:hypothetical protein